MAMREADGWLVVDCDAGDSAQVYLQVGVGGDWQPAFRDYHQGRRVAQVRPLISGSQMVTLRVDSTSTLLGSIVLR